VTHQPDYQPTLPPEFAHLKIDVADPRYVAAREFAKANNFTADQWSSMLGGRRGAQERRPLTRISVALCKGSAHILRPQPREIARDP
jgi:hypothetical protein